MYIFIDRLPLLYNLLMQISVGLECYIRQHVFVGII